MKLRTLAATLFTSALLGSLSIGSAFAYEKCHKSKWGANDQIGALNNITKDNIRLKEIQVSSRVYRFYRLLCG